MTGDTRSWTLSSAETIAAIQAHESGADALNAFLSIARADGPEESERAVPGEEAPGLLAGLPVAIKDNICTHDLPTTCGSRLLEGYQSPYDATAVRRLRAAGASIVGKTNLDEFAMGSSTEHSAFGVTRNPHDRERVPGGSSGGSAAAVAAGLVPLALGSETGGSVRQPAAFCGVVGLKPSYGRVSRYGLVAFASSLDNIAVFGRNVRDAARLLQVIAGPDPLDATCADVPVPDLAQVVDGTGVEAEQEGLVVGVPEEYFSEGLDGSVSAACERALEALAATGATVRRVSLPSTRLAIPTYYIIATAEASSNLARYDGVRFGQRAGPSDATVDVYLETRSRGFGAEVKRRIMLGTYALSAGYYDQYYGRAQRVRASIAAEFRRVFQSGVDVLFTPTTPTPAFRIGAKAHDPYEMYLSDVFTVTANLAALPAMSIPIGSAGPLPIGGQLIADRWQEATLVRAGLTLERALAGTDGANG